MAKKVSCVAETVPHNNSNTNIENLVRAAHNSEVVIYAIGILGEEERRDARRAGCVVVGFALETQDLEAGARAKLAAKDLDLVVANRLEDGAGFGADTNRVTLLGRDGAREALPLQSKDEVADAILDRVARLFDGR